VAETLTGTQHKTLNWHHFSIEDFVQSSSGLRTELNATNRYDGEQAGSSLTQTLKTNASNKIKQFHQH